MKKFLYFIVAIISASAARSQEPADALRFSWTAPSGTARQQAIGGAMGSLGGDITTAFVNPAGLAFYRTGDLVFSPALRFGTNKSNFLGRTESADAKHFLPGTTGFVMGSNRMEKGRGIQNAAFSIAFNTMASFRSETVYRSDNNPTSFSQRFLEQIQNGNIDSNSLAFDYPEGSTLAYNTYLLDKVEDPSAPRGYRYFSRAANLLGGPGLLQENKISTKGGIYEIAIGGGVSFSEKLMGGITMGIPIAHYERHGEISEADPTDDPTNEFNYATYTENIKMTGVGVNFKAGLIYKPQEFWRLGLAVHSPSFLALTETNDYSITADVEEASETVWSDYSADYDLPETKYNLITPYKLIGSISYVFREIEDVTKQRGFVTADVEYVNHKASSYKVYTEDGVILDPESKDYYKALNQTIDNVYKGAFNFRAGAEVKFTTLMVRAGAAYYGNPYKEASGQKGHKLNISGGLGYRDKGFFADLTYVHQLQKDVHYPYRLQYAAVPGADISSSGGTVLFTVGLKF